MLQALPLHASVFGRDVSASVVSPLPLGPWLILPEGCQLFCSPDRHQLLPERNPEGSHKASVSLFTSGPHATLESPPGHGRAGSCPPSHAVVSRFPLGLKKGHLCTFMTHEKCTPPTRRTRHHPTEARPQPNPQSGR